MRAFTHRTGGKQVKSKQPGLRRKLLAGVSVVFLLVVCCSNQAEKGANQGSTDAASQSEANAGQADKLPMLVDLGKGTCIPCKKMKPILEELTIEYQGRATVKVIDLRDEPQAANRYRIRLIPTQIFFDAEGQEVFRHEGFMDKQSIKAKFAEIGVY
jgi:thioredoxin 1